jgi:hypothetical protein
LEQNLCAQLSNTHFLLLRKDCALWDVKTGSRLYCYLRPLRHADIVATKNDIGYERALISAIFWCPSL